MVYALELFLGVLYERHPNYLGAPKWCFVPKLYTNIFLNAIFRNFIAVKSYVRNMCSVVRSMSLGSS